MPSLALYVLGFVILVAGLAMAANLLGVDRAWIIVGVVVLVGLMLISMAGRFNNRR